MNRFVFIFFCFISEVNSECREVDGRSTIYDEICKLLPEEIKLREGCGIGGQDNCRLCRPRECGMDQGVFPNMTRIDFLEGDILLINKTASEFLSEHAVLTDDINQVLENARFANSDYDPLLIVRNALRDKKRIWSKGIVPYTIDDNFSTDEYYIIISAMQEIERQTCVRFLRAPINEKNYVRFIKGSGCYSYIGFYGGVQPISLGVGCVYKGTVMHEIMHTLGFFHEQSRTDRDKYVVINWENILNGSEKNFRRYSQKDIDHLGENYDYLSLMHYTKYAFSKNRKQTITPIDESVRLDHSSTKNVPSSVDVNKINKLYGCTTTVECRDKLESCASWKAAGYCTNQGVFMRLACSVSCFNLCPQNECKDYLEECNWWVRPGTEESCSEYLRIVCAKKCYQCR